MAIEVIEQIDPKHAAAAYKEIESELKALPASEVQMPRVRAREVTVAMLGVARFITQPENRKQFAALPGFDITDVDRFSRYALGLWHAHSRRSVAELGSSGAKVSAALLQSATERKGRMLELLEYYLHESPRVLAELALIRSGSGYFDLAADLGELARLHREQRQKIKTDTTDRFHPEDDERALVEAASILRELSQANDAKAASDWADALARCWTLLLHAHERITRAATFLYGHRPDFDDLFPSPFAAGRRAGRKPKEEVTTPNEFLTAP